MVAASGRTATLIEEFRWRKSGWQMTDGGWQNHGFCHPPSAIPGCLSSTLMQKLGRQPLHHLTESARAHPLREGPHHLLHLQVLLQQAIDLLHARPRPLRAPFLPGAVDDLRELALFLGHRVKDRLHAMNRLL